MATVTITKVEPTLILRLKSVKEYKQGEYMTFEERKRWYREQGYITSGWKNNRSVLCPDGIYAQFLSEKDIYDELNRIYGSA